MAWLGTAVLASPAAATTYYVRTGGDDANAGLTPATAFATISRAAALLTAPGDEVIVGPGVYHDSNVQPEGNGRRDQPIVFLADETGALTGDAPGAITIMPTHATEAFVSGFLIFGRHDIVIDGFTIEGARDAGVEARPHSETGVSATRISVRHVAVRNSTRGVYLRAVGDVSVTDSTFQNTSFSAIATLGDAAGRIRPSVLRNTINSTNGGIAVQDGSGGVIASNIVAGARDGISVVSSERTQISANQVAASHDAISASGGTQLTLTDNVVTAGRLDLAAAGTIELASNVAPLLLVRSVSSADLTMTMNDIGEAVINGGDLSLTDNDAMMVTLNGDDVDVLDNRIAAGLIISATRAELRRNQAGTVAITASDALVEQCQLTQLGLTVATTAEVTGNEITGALFALRSYEVEPADPSARSQIVIADNQVANIFLGGDADSFEIGRFTANTTGHLFAEIEQDLVARGNIVRESVLPVGGLEFRMFAGDAQAEIAQNTVTGGGISLRGARGGSIEANQVRGAEIRVARSANLRIASNRVSESSGGIQIVAEAADLQGDCDGSGTVTVDEIIVAVQLALASSAAPQHCSAADANADERITVDEILAAINAATTAPPPELSSGAMTVVENVIEANLEFGIDVTGAGDLVIDANQVLGNGGSGISARTLGSRYRVTITSNVVGASAGEGLFVGHSRGSLVRDNTIFSSGQAGVLLRDAVGAQVINNLTYANGNDGIAIGVGRRGVLSSPAVVVMNNTVYGNGGWGMTLGTAGQPSPGVHVLNNIFDQNLRGGIAAELESAEDLIIEFNLQNGAYSQGVVASVTDFQADARFVDPDGADGVLGGASLPDDDFHVEPASPVVDAGSAPAADLGILGSVVAGSAADHGLVDLGFHYAAGGTAAATRLSP
ncbi:MAG TPA: right-handed parallel beta-helix repeat-containing protein [Terriglobales bacterium]|nr:right-handed parallel beta-helix repeat-containing protein [Terriglobales bacterium]